MSSKGPTVEIAGAGLSGLALSVRMAQLGWQVTLHERNADLRMFGAGIWLWGNGLKSLQMVGAYDDAVRRAKVIKEWRIADQEGTILMTRQMTAEDGLLLPPRADLYQALIDRAVAEGVTIRTSSTAVSVAREGVLVLESGEERHADLIVAADGVYSRLRESLYATRIHDYGIEAGIRMLIQHKSGDPEDIITEYWHGPWRLLYNPCTDGENYIFLSAPIEDERGRKIPIDRDFWRETFPLQEDLVNRFREDGRWDRIGYIRCRTWSDGRVAILGDAAHGMPPNLGQAANMAFTNAMALAAIVTDGKDVANSLRQWEALARPLTDHVQWWSYIYGYIIGRWPTDSMPLRGDAIQLLAKTKWFDEGINRGARSVPLGFDGNTDFRAPTIAPLSEDHFEQTLVKEMLLNVVGRQVANRLF
jgi:2-polyprenyl-6-methoxyphenol hydroxylase-like FAD-dependent oxidoreductase